jgi:hypothetical protein
VLLSFTRERAEWLGVGEGGKTGGRKEERRVEGKKRWGEQLHSK